MDPTEFLDALSRLTSTLRQSKAKFVSAKKERNHVRSVVQAWFGQYRPAFLVLLADERLLSPIDEGLQQMLKLVSASSSRHTYKRLCGYVQRHFSENLLVPLSRAYWSRVPQRALTGRDPGVARRLLNLDSALADSYEQVAEDLSDQRSKTYRGTAAELREVLRGVLERLAPDEQVKNADWYKEARRSGERKEQNPTLSERTKFILRQRNKGSSAAIEAAESYMRSVEERLGHVVRVAYGLASKATHVSAERAEVAQQLRYVNALLAELLPPEDRPQSR